MCANLMGIEAMSVKPGSPTKAVPGYDVRILDTSGAECPPNTDGAVVVRSPLPPGTLLTLWNDDDRFERSYFSTYPGYYLTGDGGRIDDDGYLYVMGRIDDVINVAGHRLSTGSMEEIIATHTSVAECAVIGVADDLKGQVPVGFVVLKAGVECDDAELEAELVAMVRKMIGPVAAFKRAMVVQRLPKTRSGKILRATMRAIADGREFNVPSTIDDPVILDEIAEALR
jgi:propionyl-CoA synthetase